MPAPDFPLWSPPAWADASAHRAHAAGIDPREVCEAGHPGPNKPGHKTCGTARAWLYGAHPTADDDGTREIGSPIGEPFWPHDAVHSVTASNKSIYRMGCWHCGATSSELSYKEAARLLKSEGPGIARRTLHEEELPTAAATRAGGVECEVRGCQDVGFEVQHWAPREYWGEAANLWPTSRLSVRCHHDWHECIGDGTYAGTDPLELMDDDGTLCEVAGCGGPGIVRHRWAPLSVFGKESRRWPTSRLREGHALEWQDTMRGRRYGGQAALDRARERKRAGMAALVSA